MTGIDDLLTNWTTAERIGDAATLDRLLTDDFAGIGLLGFVLPKQAWLQRFDSGLTYSRFGIEEIQSHDYGHAAVVTARQIAKGTWAAIPCRSRPSGPRSPSFATTVAGRWPRST